MSFSSPEQRPTPQDVPNGTLERGEENINPLTEAQSRITQAGNIAHANQNRVSHIPTAEKEPPVIRISESGIANKTRADTLAVIDSRIARMQATLQSDREAAKSVSWGQRFDSTFKLGGLLATTAREADAEGIEQQESAIAKMQGLRTTVASTASIDGLKKIRAELGLAALPQELVADYDTYQAMVKAGVESKNKELEVDWAAINEQLKAGEVILNGWETFFEVLDTGVGIAAGLVPFGSEVYEISHALTDVAVGTKTADQAARDFAFGIIASRVGGKSLKKLNVDEIAGEWAKKNAKFFSEKTATALARITGKGAAGATQGSISGATEGIMHGTYNVGTGKATLEQAVGDTVNRAVIGGTFGGVLGAAGEGLMIRSEGQAAKRKAELRDNIMQLPETDEGRALRTMAAEDILERPLSPEQQQAVLAAHDVPMKDGQKYSMGELAQKMRILEESGLSRDDAAELLRMGVCGSLPPPQPITGNLASAPPSNQQPTDAPLPNTPTQPQAIEGSTSNSEQFSPASTNKGKILPPPPPLKGNKIPTTSPKETFTPGQLIDIPVGSNTIPPGRYVMKTLKDADGDPINVLVSQDGKKAYPVEKDLKSISFTLVNTAPVIPDHDVGNNIAKRPVISNVPNKIQAESFIKKMAEESGDARITAEVITGNLNHVTQPQFEKALEASIEDFNSSIDDNTSYAVIGGRSRKWTFDLAKEKGMKGSKSAVVIGDSELEIKRMLQENSRIKNIVLIDDASYSGNQLNEYITSIQAQAKLAGREVQIHIVTPFMTNYSQKRLMRPGVTIVAHETIQTIHEIAESEAQKRGIPKEKVIQVLRERYDLRQDDGRSVGLTYFDHKIPDNQSFLATRQNRLNVLRGIVVDSNGNEKVIGTREEQIPFLEDDGTTSLITTTLPIYDEAPISQQTQTPY